MRFLLWPLLLPRTIWRWLRRPRRRKLKLTREGKYFVAITIGIGMAAINTGNNLLYLLLGWLLSVIIASGILSDFCLRSIRITRSWPKRIFAGRPFLIEISAENQKARLASYSLEVEDQCEKRVVDKRCYFLKIPESKTQRTSYRHTLSRRGLHKFTGFRIATKFPFGLFIKSRISEHEDELLVYPEVHPVQIPPPMGSLQGDNYTNKVGRRGEFFGLREYREGDDRRAIHWRSSARSDRLMVREYEDESQKRITLVVDNALPPSPSEEEEQALEEAISQTASLAQAYLKKGYSLRLVARDLLLPFGHGEMHVEKVLKTLALLPTKGETDKFGTSLKGQMETLLIVPAGVKASGRPMLPMVGKDGFVRSAGHQSGPSAGSAAPEGAAAR